MDPLELFDLKAAFTKLETEMDALPASERVRLATTVRSSIDAGGIM